jgi:Zn-dependent metalloprotease
MTIRNRGFFGTIVFLAGLAASASFFIAGAQTPSGIQVKPLPPPVAGVGAVNAQTQPNDPSAQAIATVLRERLAAIQTRQQLTSEQKTALDGLSERYKVDVEIRMRPEAGTPRHIRGALLEKAAGSASPGEDRDVKTARAFLRANRALLRIDDPDHEFELTRLQRDQLDRRHLRFAQRHQGLPVWPADVIVHLDPAGNVDLLDGAYVPTPREVGVKPVVDANAAVDRARQAVTDGAKGTAGKPDLIIYAPGDRLPRLGWKLELSISAGFRWLVVIDAMNGATLTVFNQIQDASAAGSGLDLIN